MQTRVDMRLGGAHLEAADPGAEALALHAPPLARPLPHHQAGLLQRHNLNPGVLLLSSASRLLCRTQLGGCRSGRYPSWARHRLSHGYTSMNPWHSPTVPPFLLPPLTCQQQQTCARPDLTMLRGSPALASCSARLVSGDVASGRAHGIARLV